mgnify:CR=1 FL=1
MSFTDLMVEEKTRIVPFAGRRFMRYEGFIRSGWGLTDYLQAAIKGERFECAVIWGPPGTGKSNLARQLLYRLYSDWEKVLRYTVTGIDEMLEIVRELRSGSGRPPAIVLDDISRVLPRQLWHQNKQLYIAFSKALQVIRSLFNVIIVTVPDVRFLPEPIINMQTFEVHVTPEHRYYAQRHIKIPDFYRRRDAFIFKTLVEIGFFRLQDEPLDVFNRYSHKRRQMAFDAMDEVERAMARGVATEGGLKPGEVMEIKKPPKQVYEMVCLACGHKWRYKPQDKPASIVTCPKCRVKQSFQLLCRDTLSEKSNT